MIDRKPFLMFGRRFHDVFRGVIENGDGRDPNVWAQERGIFEHYSSGMYLSGCLAYLEGVYGRAPWNQKPSGDNFDTFLSNHPVKHQRENFKKAGISSAGLNALVCIRNAYIHNASDLSKNDDKDSLRKVTSAALPGVTISGTVVQLTSNRTEDFMKFVRLSLVAVAQFHGDG